MKLFSKAIVGVALTGVALQPVSLLANSEEKDVKVTVGGWGRVIMAPAASNFDARDSEDKDVVSPRDSTSWGDSARIGITIKGESKNIGFRVDMNTDNLVRGYNDKSDTEYPKRGVTVHDEQKVWAKPIEGLTVELGQNIYYEALRGNSTYGAWEWARFAGIEGEDQIFPRGLAGNESLGKESASGSIIHYDADGFHVFAALDIDEEGKDLGRKDAAGKAVREEYTSEMMFARGQYGVGYNIKGLGLARIQYIGKSYVEDSVNDNKAKNYGIINAAFKMDQLVEDLYLDVGIFVPTKYSSKNNERTRFALYGKYAMGMVTTHGLLNMTFDQDYVDDKGDNDDGLGLKVGLGADIDLGDGLVINTDLRYHNEAAVKNIQLSDSTDFKKNEDIDNQTAFLIGIQKGFSNGVIGIALQATNLAFQAETDKEKSDDLAWSIPVKIEYDF